MRSTPEQRNRMKAYYEKHREELIKRARERRQKMSPEQKEIQNEHERARLLLNPRRKPTLEQRARRNARNRERYARDEAFRINMSQRAKKWRQAFPHKWKEQHLRQKYQITLECRNALMGKQHGQCAICGYSDLADPRHFPVVDHCHRTGVVRGLLCRDCNQGLGQFKDSPQLMRAAADYVEEGGKA